MAKFVYRMQSILNIKEKMEEQAKLAFAAARQQLTTEEERLQRLAQRRIQYLAEGAVMRQQVLDPLKLQENEAALTYIKEAIIDQRIRVRKAEEALERARIILQEYMIERKTHEQLREAAFEAFQEELIREESKEVDELVSYTYGQKRG
ncbi:MAG: flagellar export protein FliJ [Lachnospiraceae bacterium]|jgi:flagellar FliJ protein|nr:flagellar export protein FliJ [Lachnospiraceae bacterium]